MELKQINKSEVTIIKDLAYQIWPDAYSEILSNEQLVYMLDLIYDEKALVDQLDNHQLFYVLYENQKPIGFLGIEHNCKNSNKTKIHKIYLLPETQGKGFGKWMIVEAEKLAKEQNQVGIFLNVNKYNKAKVFYESQGFSIVKEEVIDIGNNYVMDDYVMEKIF